MKDSQSSYRQIMKATSLFGGVQAFNILISIIKSKVVAVLLGPMGMGVLGLLSSTINLITTLTNFRLGNSAVKDISHAYTNGNDQQIGITISVLNRLVVITGLLGAVTTLVLSPWLSEITFGDKSYTTAFIWLSISLLLNQLSSGKLVLLQGMRRLKYLAKANMLGSLSGLLISLPFYYFFGVDGIVPTIIISSLFSLLISWFFSNKINVQIIKISLSNILKEGKGMIELGVMLSLTSLMTAGESFIVRSYISNTGGLDDVGLYSAGFAIIGTYVGLIFAAMGTDYFPRLSAIAENNEKTKSLVIQQAEIALFILSPILLVFFIFINWVIIILYSTKFLPVNEMIHWAALGMYFKVVSWCIGYIFLAKGASKTFFWSELFGTSYLLVLNIIGYKFYGLEGLGISFLISYCLILIQVFLITKYKYRFGINKEFYKVFGIQFLLAVISFLISKFIKEPYMYLFGLLTIALGSWYSIYELDKRLDIKSIIKNFSKKN